MQTLAAVIRSFVFRVRSLTILLSAFIFFIYMLVWVKNVSFDLNLLAFELFVIIFSLIVSVPIFLICNFIDRKLRQLAGWKRKLILFMVGAPQVILLIWAFFYSEFDKKDLFVDGLVVCKIFFTGLVPAILMIRIPEGR